MDLLTSSREAPQRAVIPNPAAEGGYLEPAQETPADGVHGAPSLRVLVWDYGVR